MISRRYAILALVTSAQAGASIVQQGFGSLAPAISADLHIGHAAFGLLFGILMAGAAGTTALAGLIVDSAGERTVIFYSGLLMGAALIASALFASYAWLAGCLLLYGIGYAATTPAGGRAILLWFDTDRGLAMGIRQMGVPVGGVLGALVLPLIANHLGYRPALAAGGAACIVLSILAVVWYREPAGAVPVKRTLREALHTMADVVRDRRMQLVTATCMILISMQSNMLTFLTQTLVTSGGLALALAATGFAVAQTAAGFGRVIFGSLSDRLFGGDRVGPMMLALCGSSLCCAGMALLRPGEPLVAFVLSFFLGLSAAGWNGLFAAANVEIGGPSRAGSAIGVGLTGIFTTGFLAPPIFGYIADHAGLPAAWATFSVVALAGLWPAIFARRAMREGSAVTT
jgi:MFS family permease